MRRTVPLGDRLVGDGQRVFVIAEMEINLNGSPDVARRLIDAAMTASCDAVTRQTRTPERCVPPDQRDVASDTPWGRLTYLGYPRRLEFGETEHVAIDRCCREVGILWFALFLDEASLHFLERFDPPCPQDPFRPPRLGRPSARGTCHRRCFVIGEGPSLRECDLRRLAGETSFVTNHDLPAGENLERPQPATDDPRAERAEPCQPFASGHVHRGTAPGTATAC